MKTICTGLGCSWTEQTEQKYLSVRLCIIKLGCASFKKSHRCNSYSSTVVVAGVVGVWVKQLSKRTASHLVKAACTFITDGGCWISPQWIMHLFIQAIYNESYQIAVTRRNIISGEKIVWGKEKAIASFFSLLHPFCWNSWLQQKSQYSALTCASFLKILKWGLSSDRKRKCKKNYNMVAMKTSARAFLCMRSACKPLSGSTPDDLNIGAQLEYATYNLYM